MTIAIIFGKGVTAAEPGSIDRLVLAVSDAGGGIGFCAGTEARAPGADTQRRSYASYASFSDPDGNGWLLQEIKERLPGRV